MDRKSRKQLFSNEIGKNDLETSIQKIHTEVRCPKQCL